MESETWNAIKQRWNYERLETALRKLNLNFEDFRENFEIFKVYDKFIGVLKVLHLANYDSKLQISFDFTQ